MANNDETYRNLGEFLEYAEEKLGGKLAMWQRTVLTRLYHRYGDCEVVMYVDEDDREYGKVDDELSDLVDEFLSSPAKGKPVAVDLGDVSDKVRVALEEAGYSVTHDMDTNTTTYAAEFDVSEVVRDMARQLTESIDTMTVKALDDTALGRLVELVNDEWESRGHLVPKDEEQLHAPEYGKGVEADADTRAYAAGHGAYLGALMANGFSRNEAMAMVMFELHADLARDIHGKD